MNTAVQRRVSGMPALDLVEEAFALLRRAPASAHLAYYVGSIPFWLGFLYFLADMSRDAYASSHLTDWSLIVALLYVWKKVWQSVSAAKLRATLTGVPDQPWTVRRVLRATATQAALQPWGLVLRPIAAIIALPLVWTSGFFQNLVVLGDGTVHSRGPVARALEQAKLWPGQAHKIVIMLKVFLIFVWLNIAIGLGAAPFMLKSLLGIETIYSRSGMAFFNTTFFATTVALTSLVIDPLRKALFVLRCFHGSSRHSGEDLSAELRVFSGVGAAAAALMLIFLPMTAPAQNVEPPRQAEPAELDRRIDETLERREYAWRAPREKDVAVPEKDKSWLAKWLDEAGKSVENFLSAVGRQTGRFFRWMKNLFNPPTMPTTGGPNIDWVGLSKAVLVLLAAALIGVLAWLLVRSVRQRKKVVVAQAAAPIVPDLRSEDIVADQLPEDGWLVLARDHAARGEFSLALRAAWLAGLAHLGQRELIRIARHKSNRDYERELRRRARDRASLLHAFDDNMLSVERAWYGRHEADAEVFALFQQNLERIRQS